jgi:hypothetical protein
MSRVRPYSVGLVFALFLGMWHVLWSLLVWLGAAQWLLDFIFRLHMITPPYTVSAFNLGTAAGLVLVTACIGFAGGWAAGAIWNGCVPSDTKV